MHYNGDIGLYLSGADIPIPECSLFIKQPTVKQILQFGETNYLSILQLIGNSTEALKEMREANTALSDLSDFQLLLLIVQQEEQLKESLNNFFELVCPNFNITYNQDIIDFSLKEDESNMVVGRITEWTFPAFQEVVKEVLIPYQKDADIYDYKPKNKAAAEIAEKLKKGRAKVNQQKGKGQQISLYGSYISILSVGLSMDINILLTYTSFQIIDIFNRYFAKVEYDLYQKIATTPLMSTDNMESPRIWTDNLYITDVSKQQNGEQKYRIKR